MIGTWVNTIKCAGPDACNNANMKFEQSMGIICSTRSCVGATFTLNSNRGGGIICSAPDACMDATIIINGNIQNIMCGGTNGCKNAKIILTNPMEGLLISCGGIMYISYKININTLSSNISKIKHHIQIKTCLCVTHIAPMNIDSN